MPSIWKSLSRPKAMSRVDAIFVGVLGALRNETTGAVDGVAVVDLAHAEGGRTALVGVLGRLLEIAADSSVDDTERQTASALAGQLADAVTTYAFGAALKAAAVTPSAFGQDVRPKGIGPGGGVTSGPPARDGVGRPVTKASADGRDAAVKSRPFSWRDGYGRRRGGRS